jgi:hypothetical protein
MSLRVRLKNQSGVFARSLRSLYKFLNNKKITINTK